MPEAADPPAAAAQPATAAKPGEAAKRVKPAKPTSARRRSREFALQALYQHLVGGNDAASIDAFTRDLAGFHKADSVHYDALLHGSRLFHGYQDRVSGRSLMARLWRMK